MATENRAWTPKDTNHRKTSWPSHRTKGTKAVAKNKPGSMPCNLLPFSGCVYYHLHLNEGLLEGPLPILTPPIRLIGKDTAPTWLPPHHVGNFLMLKWYFLMSITRSEMTSLSRNKFVTGVLEYGRSIHWLRTCKGHLCSRNTLSSAKLF